MKRALDDSLLPMINIVFLLLIFFLVAGRLAPTPTLPVTPPESDHATPIDPKGLRIEVSATGDLQMNGAAVTLEALTAQVTAQLAEVPSAIPVIVKADQRLNAQQLLTVFQALRAAQVTRVNLLSVQARKP